jgi:hypothetical protein
MLKEVLDPRDGYKIVSEETGLQYDLLELESYRGESTSDIVAIFVALPEFGYLGQLDYLFGASDLGSMLDNCKEIIQEFENGEREMISSLDVDGDLAEYVKHNNLKIKLKEVK